MQYISPIRYQGSKRSLIPVIKQLAPQDCTNMIDAFGGSATVVLNMDHRRRMYCESYQPVFEIVDTLASVEPHLTVNKVKRLVKRWKLDKHSPDNFFAFRDHANNSRDPLMFYILHRHAHSNLLRFNQDGEYNVPFGNRGIADKMEDVEREIYTFFYNMQDVQRVNARYGQVLLDSRSKLNHKTFIYFDPPYLASGANCYDSWSEKYEHQLLRNLERLTVMGVKWMLSNVTQHRHFRNDVLIKWLKKNKIRVVYPNKTYALANLHGDSHSTVEIIAMNY